MSRPRPWRDLLRLFDFRCAYCQRSATEVWQVGRDPRVNGHRPGGLTKDHVVPVSRGGRYRVVPDNRKPWDNIVPACRSCNEDKQSRTLWAEWTPPNPHPALMRLYPREAE